ncbi:MAG: DUF2798 domain-containing protein [Treponema sp.]|jgi:hypothetical protein|nr:DUF2798 domain-containing protein [Treponema sp.]
MLVRKKDRVCIFLQYRCFSRQNKGPANFIFPKEYSILGIGVDAVNLRQILFFGFCMAVIMSMCMSLAMTAINVGFNHAFLMAWLKGWGAGFLASLPLSFILPPLLHKIMQKLKL